MPNIQATIVFEKNWEAIHARNPDGSRRWRYIINEGSSRSSKTWSIIQILYLYAYQNKAKRLSVWRETKKDSRDTIGNDMKVGYPSMPFAERVNFNKTESIYQFPNSSVIEICGTDEPNRLHGYNCNVAHLNEPYGISKDTFDQLDMRTSDFVMIDWNPKQSHWIEDLKKDSRCIVIKSTFKDNPFCPDEQRYKILSYQPVSRCFLVESKTIEEGPAKVYDILANPLNFQEKHIKELSRCIENERKASASLFNWAVYGLGEKADKPNRIFNNWVEIPNHEYEAIKEQKFYGVDWGEVDPWGILEAKYYDGAIYFHELNYRSENEIKQLLTHVELAEVNKLDEGLVGWIFNKLKIPKEAYIVCDDNRAMKVVALRVAGYDNSITATKGPGSILDGINLLGKLRVFYTSSSSNIKMEIEAYSWRMEQGIITEEPEDANNHTADPARYIVQFMRELGIIKII